jgi:hypothetical protein
VADGVGTADAPGAVGVGATLAEGEPVGFVDGSPWPC